VTCKLAKYPHGLACYPTKRAHQETENSPGLLHKGEEPMISSLSFYRPIESNKQPKLGFSKYKLDPCGMVSM
jgi:hypothetical protein